MLTPLRTLKLNQVTASSISPEGFWPKSKFMQSLDPHVYSELSRLAKEKGVSGQELIRTLIIPDWMRTQDKIGKVLRREPT